MTWTSDSNEVTEGSRRSRKWRIGLAVVAVLVAIQSITITLPIRGRILDETSGQPVPGAALAAFWELDAYGFEVTPGGTVRMAETETDDNGVFRIPMAFIVHLPLLPFSVLARSEGEMPMLIVVADGYHPSTATNDVLGIHGPRHGAGFLFVRTSSLDGADLRLTPRGEGRDYIGDLGWASSAIQMGAGYCAQRALCVSHPLPRMWEALRRGGLRIRASPQRDEHQ